MVAGNGLSLYDALPALAASLSVCDSEPNAGTDASVFVEGE